MHQLTIAEAAPLIKARKLSPVELAEACIGRAEALEGRLNVYITRLFDAARREARAAEAEIGRGEYRGPLHGIPVGLKDLYDVAGVRTTAGSRVMADNVAAADAATVARLRQAGAVFPGKVNTHEIAFGVTTDNPHYGRTGNPWNPDHIPGGSSGGSAAGVGACYFPAALGTDTGASIRQPAACCGVTGLKPTYGRVSKAGVVPLSWSLDHPGPLARSAEDCALVLQALAGQDPDDPTTAAVPVDDYLKDIGGGVKGLVIGLAEKPFFDVIDPEVDAAVRAAVRHLESLGARVEVVDVSPWLSDPEPCYAIMRTEAATVHEKWLQERPQDYGADVLARLRQGEAVSGVQFVKALWRRAPVQRAIAALMQNIDLLALPSMVVPPPPFAMDGITLGGRPVRELLTKCTWPFNYTGQPALSLPCGFSAGGLPISLQLVGRPFEEATVLRAGHAYQSGTTWHRRLPPL